MKWTPKKLSAAAGLGLAALLWYSVGPSRPTPESVLADARVTLREKHFDDQEVLRRLDEAFDEAQAKGENDLCAEILLTRGELLMSLGAVETARRSFERVLTRFRPGDPETRRLLVRASEETGDYDTAVEQLASLLRDEPEYGPAWVESGLLHQKLADKKLAACTSALSPVLVSDELARAERLLARLAAMDPLDSARTTIAFGLREIVPSDEEERLATALVLADDASRELAQARSDYIESFRRALDPEAVSGYLSILVSAGELERAIDFGLVASRDPLVVDHQPTAAVLVRALLDRGDPQRAGTIAASWVKRDAPIGIPFLHLCSEALYAAKDWPSLLRCDFLISRVGTLHDIEISSFYRGLAMANSGAGVPAMMTLRGWLRLKPDEPWPGAMLEFWHGMAKAAAHAHDDVQERLALDEIVRLDPDADGAAWLRIAELQVRADHTGLGTPLRSLAHAMRLLPQRNAKLLPMFRRLGERALQASNQELELVFQDLAREQRVLPKRDPGPYVLLRLAEMHRDLGHTGAVLILCDQLLAGFPGFVPAIDLEIDARLAQGDAKTAAELALQRLEATGPDETTQTFFDRLADYPYDEVQVVRMLRADPEHAGRRQVARYLRETGELDGALRCLRADGSDRDPLELTMAAQILVEEGRYVAALKLLAQVAEGGKARKGSAAAGAGAARRALPLTLVAALHAGDGERVEAALRAILSDPSVTSSTVLAAASTLLRLGAADKALLVLRKLDEPRTRTGESLVTLGLAALADGKFDAASEAIDRAEAYLRSDAASYARLVVAGVRGEWSSVERAASELVASLGSESTPRAAALRVLAGDPARALDGARAALATDPNDTLWTILAAAARARLTESAPSSAPFELPPAFGPAADVQTRLFVRGSELFPHDPREVALVVAALEDPLLAPWAGARLSALDPAKYGELWPALCESSLLQAIGEGAEARLVLADATRRFPRCLPAWNELEALIRRRSGGADHPELRALRDRRLEALGLASPESPEGLLLRARRALDEGLAQPAEALAQRAIERRPAWPEAQAVLAAALAKEERYPESIEAWRRACVDPPATESRPWVAGFLDTLSEAELVDPPVTRPSDTLAELERLAKHLPDDPRVALALAELELRRDPRNPTLCVARAYARLEGFRNAHMGRTLAELQPGSAADWARFYASLDPEAARKFLESERLREPGNIELWIQLGSALRQAGELERSTDSLLFAARMCPDPRAYWELATTLAARAAPPPQVKTALDRARDLERGDPLETRSVLEREPLLEEAIERATGDAPGEVSELLEQSPSEPEGLRITEGDVGSEATELPSEDEPDDADAAAKRPVRGDLVYAETLVRQLQPPAWTLALKRLDALWDRRAALKTNERTRAGELLVQALLLRRGPSDVERALEIAEEIAPHVREPYRRSMLDALVSLASSPQAEAALPAKSPRAARVAKR